MTYEILEAEAVAIGWPLAYQTDLTLHDRDTLATKKPDAFVWVLRQHGTNLYTEPSFWNLVVLDYLKISSPTARIYLFRHGQLEPTTDKAASDFLLQRETVTREAALAGIDFGKMISKDTGDVWSARSHLRHLIEYGTATQTACARALQDYWFPERV